MSGSDPGTQDLDADSRSARELVAGGPSKIERSRAMRVRDINRPTQQDLDEAGESVQIVHRNWTPPR